MKATLCYGRIVGGKLVTLKIAKGAVPNTPNQEA